MDKMMQHYFVVLDGIDKTGKDTIAKMLWQMDRRLNILIRGWPSCMAYSKKYNRNVVYPLPDKDAVYVHLTVNKEDWKLRCIMTNEPEIDYDYESGLFSETFKILDNNNYHILTFDTSEITPYNICVSIVNYLKQLNKEN